MIFIIFSYIVINFDLYVYDFYEKEILYIKVLINVS